MTTIFKVFRNLYAEGIYAPNIKDGDYVDVFFPDESGEGRVENEDRVPVLNAIQAIQFAANVTNYTGYVRVEKGTDIDGSTLWTEFGFQNGKPSYYSSISPLYTRAEEEFERSLKAPTDHSWENGRWYDHTSGRQYACVDGDNLIYDDSNAAFNIQIVDSVLYEDGYDYSTGACYLERRIVTKEDRMKIDPLIRECKNEVLADDTGEWTSKQKCRRCDNDGNWYANAKGVETSDGHWFHSAQAARGKGYHVV